MNLWVWLWLSARCGSGLIVRLCDIRFHMGGRQPLLWCFITIFFQLSDPSTPSSSSSSPIQWWPPRFYLCKSVRYLSIVGVASMVCLLLCSLPIEGMKPKGGFTAKKLKPQNVSFVTLSNILYAASKNKMVRMRINENDNSRRFFSIHRFRSYLHSHFARP